MVRGQTDDDDVAPPPGDFFSDDDVSMESVSDGEEEEEEEEDFLATAGDVVAMAKERKEEEAEDLLQENPEEVENVILAMQEVAEAQELAEINADIHRQELANVEKKRRKMAPGITLDDSPEKLAPPDDPQAQKRARFFLESVIANPGTPTDKSEKQAAKILAQEIAAQRIADDGDSEESDMGDVLQLKVLMDRYTESTDAAEKRKLLATMREIENRQPHSGLDLEEATMAFSTDTRRLQDMIDRYDDATPQEKKEMAVEIEELQKRQARQQELSGINHKRIFQTTGASYWKQDILGPLYSEPQFAWVPQVAALPEGSSILDATEPDFSKSAVRVLRATGDAEDPAKPFTLSKEDARMVRRLFTRADAGMDRIITASLIGSGFSLMDAAFRIVRRLKHAEKERGDDSKVKQLKWSAMMHFTNVIPKAFSDILLMTSQQLRWRYKDVRTTKADQHPIHTLHKVLRRFFSNYPDNDAANSILRDMLISKVFAVSWIPIAVRSEVPQFMARITAIAQSKEVSVKVGTPPVLKESNYFVGLSRLQVDISALSELTDKNAYLDTLRDLKSVRNFFSTVAYTSKEGQNMITLKRRRFAPSLISADDPHDFLSAFASYMGTVPKGHIDATIMDVAKEVSNVWKAAFLKRAISKLYYRESTPAMIRTIFGTHDVLEARLKNVADVQGVIVTKLRRMAKRMTDTTNARENMHQLRENARQELGSRTTDAEAKHFLEVFDIYPESRGLRGKDDGGVTDKAKASALIIKINTLYVKLFRYLASYSDSARIVRETEILTEAGLPTDWLSKTRDEINASKTHRMNTSGGQEDIVAAASHFTTTREELERLDSVLSDPSLNEELRALFRYHMRRIVVDAGDEDLSEKEKFESVREHAFKQEEEDEEAIRIYLEVSYEWFKADPSDTEHLMNTFTIKKVNSLFKKWEERGYRTEREEKMAKLRARVVSYIKSDARYTDILRSLGEDYKVNALTWLERPGYFIPEALYKEINTVFSNNPNKSATFFPSTEDTKQSSSVPDFGFGADVGANESDSDDDVPLVPPQEDSRDDEEEEEEEEEDEEPSSSFEMPSAQLQHPDLLEEFEAEVNAGYLEEEDATKKKKAELVVIDLSDDEDEIFGDADTDLEVIVINDDSDNDSDSGAPAISKSLQERLVEQALESESKNLGSISTRRRLLENVRNAVIDMLNDEHAFPERIASIKAELNLPMFNFMAVLRDDVTVLSVSDLQLLKSRIDEYQNASDDDDDDTSLLDMIYAQTGNGPAVHYIPDYKPNALVV